MSNNMNTSGNATTRTILRIKRRRTEEPLPYIRLEGLDASRTGSKRETVEDTTNTTSVPPRSTTALWRRFEETEAPETEDSYRIVNAMLLSDGDDERQTKRRKLTVLETTTSDLPLVVSLPKSNRPTTIRVLDPLSRMVDDSLQEVHIGNKQVSEHYRFVTTDSNLMYDSKKWLAWCHAEGGNLLHACALWNDVEMASELLTLMSAAPLTEALDADGRTPYEVAQLSGHDSVCEVLEAFGGDTSNFVYDIFCLDDDQQQNKDNNEQLYGSQKDGSSSEDQLMAVELTSGVGYWTPEGELILEAPEKSPASLTHVFDDGEIDSNCEEYGGNDYPEDEDWGDEDDEFLSQQQYRQHNSIDMYREEADYNDLVHSSGYD